MTDFKHSSMGHETDDANVRAIVLTGITFSLAVAIVLWLVWGMFRYLVHHPIETAPSNPLAETERQQFPQAPRIEEHPAIEMHELRKQEDHVLSTYGWTDKKSGVVRIPIDRAIELQMERGFPVREQAVKK
jgi:hypothetical protein